MTDLATLLNGCEVKVKAACATDNMPLPNMTEVGSPFFLHSFSSQL